ncbi:MAG: SMI1/KNR4 family protein [Bacteroidota bacterium]
MEDFSIIPKVLGKYFDFCKEPGQELSLSDLRERIPKEMLDHSRDKGQENEDYSFWLPLKSNVTEKEISDLESLLRNKLPASFKHFLQQRYFVAIRFTDVDFFSNLPGLLVSAFREKIDNYYPQLPRKNYLPFATYRDYGVLAFDANKNATNNEYEIVILDHEDDYTTPELYARSFLLLFDTLDKQLGETIKQITDYRNNS